VLIWSSGKEVSVEEAKAAISTGMTKPKEQVLDQSLGNGFDLQELMSEVATHYLKRAIKESGGVKTKAANLVGLPSYQTFSNWLNKYGVKEP
jgi:DNA-binding NtrC family response regulator